MASLQTGLCNFCKKKGHKQRDCPRRLANVMLEAGSMRSVLVPMETGPVDSSIDLDNVRPCANCAWASLPQSRTLTGEALPAFLTGVIITLAVLKTFPELQKNY